MYPFHEKSRDRYLESYHLDIFLRLEAILYSVFPSLFYPFSCLRLDSSLLLPMISTKDITEAMLHWERAAKWVKTGFELANRLRLARSTRNKVAANSIQDWLLEAGTTEQTLTAQPSIGNRGVIWRDMVDREAKWLTNCA